MTKIILCKKINSPVLLIPKQFLFKISILIAAYNNGKMHAKHMKFMFFAVRTFNFFFFFNFFFSFLGGDEIFNIVQIMINDSAHQYFYMFCSLDFLDERLKVTRFVFYISNIKMLIK